MIKESLNKKIEKFISEYLFPSLTEVVRNEEGSYWKTWNTDFVVLCKSYNLVDNNFTLYVHQQKWEKISDVFGLEKDEIKKVLDSWFKKNTPLTYDEIKLLKLGA